VDISGQTDTFDCTHVFIYFFSSLMSIEKCACCFHTCIWYNAGGSAVLFSGERERESYKCCCNLNICICIAVWSLESGSFKVSFLMSPVNVVKFLMEHLDTTQEWEERETQRKVFQMLDLMFDFL